MILARSGVLLGRGSCSGAEADGSGSVRYFINENGTLMRYRCNAADTAVGGQGEVAGYGDAMACYGAHTVIYERGEVRLVPD